MKLTTERLLLRDIGYGDLSDIVQQANDLEVAQYLLLMPHPYTDEDGRNFIELCKNTAYHDPRTDYILGIELLRERRLIGVIGLHHADPFQGTAIMGYWLGKSYWHNGYMSEAVDRMISFVFDTLKLRRINIEAYVENEGSIKIIERAGFQSEGLCRSKNRCLATGKLHDVRIFGLLKDEWRRRKRRTHAAK